MCQKNKTIVDIDLKKVYYGLVKSNNLKVLTLIWKENFTKHFVNGKQNI